MASSAADGLCKTLLMFDAFHDVEEKAKAGNAQAQRVLESWASAEWFENRPAVPESITLTVFGMRSHTSNPGTLLGMACISPWTSAGASGLGSNVSCEEGEP